MWFDVDKERNTTTQKMQHAYCWLWFDVDKERNTTAGATPCRHPGLWFDVDKERNTTWWTCHAMRRCCGLM